MHFFKDRIGITIALLIGLFAVFVGVSVMFIVQSERSFMASYQVKAQSQARLLGENLSGKFYAVDLTLMSAISMMMSGESDAVSATEHGLISPLVGDFIQSQIRFLPLMENVVFYAADGHKQYQYLEFMEAPFTAFARHRDAWLGFSVITAFDDVAHPRILLSRRVEDFKSIFKGVLLAVISPTRLGDPYIDFMDSDADRIVVLNEEGRVLADWSKHFDERARFVGAAVQTIPGMAGLPSRLLTVGGLQTFEDDRTIVSAFQLPLFPFRTLVIFEKDRLRENWYQQTRERIWMVGVTALLVVLAVIVSIVQITNRRRAEVKLQEYREHLEALVEKRTAALAGLNLELKAEIRERQKAEGLIKASLKEKTTLLQEIHHRVKNNMAVISSLLRLQAGRIGDQRVKAALQESQNRIKAMSMVHESLYRADNLSEIELGPYLSMIAGTVLQTYQASNRHIELKMAVADIRLTAKKATPVGLIINELVSNAIKYAFPDERTGSIEISGDRRDGVVTLMVTDNGVGLPQGFDWQGVETLGLKLVKMLAENQLNGSVETTLGDGAGFIVRFPFDGT